LSAAGYVDLQRQNLRGRRPVRADRQLRTDEKHIRAQSAILDETLTAVFGVNHNHVFCTDVLFIRTENVVGARERAIAAKPYNA
jgi:hypothetical protein